MFNRLAHHRTLILTAAVATASTLVATLVVQSFWRLLDEGDLAKVMVTAEEAPKVAELLDQHNERVVPPFTVPTQVPVDVQPGDYRLRVGGAGDIGRTYEVSLPQGESRMFPVGPDERYRWRIESDFREYELLDFGDRIDPVVMNERGMTRFNSRSGEPVCQFQTEEHFDTLREQLPGFLWPTRQFGIDHNSASPRWRMISATDVNNDGTNDVIVASQRQAWLLAIDGASGDVLWTAGRGWDVTEPSEALINNDYRYEIISAVVGAPLVVPDLNDDGTTDLISTFFDTDEDPFTQKQPELTRWTEAISGATGETLWRVDYAADLFAGAIAPPRLAAPLERMSDSSGSGGSSYGERYIRGRPQLSPSGPMVHVPATPRLVDADGESPMLLTIAGGEFTTLDLVTGRTLSSTKPAIPSSPEADWLPQAPVQLADLTGNGSNEVICLDPVPTGAGTDNSTRIIVLSAGADQVLWQRDIKAKWPEAFTEEIGPPDWPLLNDLDGDGSLEIIVPTDSAVGRTFDKAWGSLGVLEGKTGKALWTSQLFTSDQHIDYFTVGPDLNGDGTREIFAATFWGYEADLYMDALSGKDGKSLWRSHPHRMRTHDRMSNDYRVASIEVWDAGGDGWPQLVVHVATQGRFEMPVALFYSAGTGRLLHIGRDIHGLRTADLDRDGVDELITLRAVDQTHRELACVRGLTADRVRMLRSRWRHWSDEQVYAVGDLDGDGTSDLAVCTGQSDVRVSSSVTGKQLWKTSSNDLRRSYQSIATPSAASPQLDHDLDGDGVPDVLVSNRPGGMQHTPLVVAFSGATGRQLWSSEVTARRMRTDSLVLARDLDIDGRPEVVMLSAHAPPSSNVVGNNERLTLHVLSGGTGAVQWQQELQITDSPWSRRPSAKWFETGFVDLDGNGVLDIAVPAEPEDGSSRFELRAYRGEDGELLWRHSLRNMQQQRRFADLNPPAVTDVDGDGRPELLVLDVVDQRGPRGTSIAANVRLLDGVSGESRWEFEHTLEHSLVASRRDHLRPVLLSTDDGLRFSMSLAESRDAIVLIDAKGNVVKAPTTSERRRQGDYRERLAAWVCDVEADGVDELVVRDHNTLSVVRSDKLTDPLWQKSVDDNSRGWIRVFPARGSCPAQVVVRTPENGELTSYHAATGEPLWTCPIGQHYVARNDESAIQVLFNELRPSEPPHVLFSTTDETTCRQAIPTDESRQASIVRPTATPTPLGPDPRLARRLPWYARTARLRDMVMEITWSSVFSVLLIWLPGAFVWRMIARRQWGLRTMLAAPAIVAMVLMVQRFSPPGTQDYWTVGTRWGVALTAFPVIAYIVVVGRAILQRDRRRLRHYVILTLVLTVVAGALGMVATRFSGPAWQPGEYYVMDGWYLLFFVGCYFTGLVLSFAIPITLFVKWIGGRSSAGA